MIAIIPHVRNIPCLDSGGGRARSVTNSLDKYHFNAASTMSVRQETRRELWLARQDPRLTTFGQKSRSGFTFCPGDRGGRGGCLVNTSSFYFPQIHRL